MEHGAVQRYTIFMPCEGERGDRQACTYVTSNLSFFLQQLSIFTFTKGLPINLFLSSLISSNPEREKRKDGVIQACMLAVVKKTMIACQSKLIY